MSCGRASKCDAGDALRCLVDRRPVTGKMRVEQCLNKSGKMERTVRIWSLFSGCAHLNHIGILFGGRSPEPDGKDALLCYAPYPTVMIKKVHCASAM